MREHNIVAGNRKQSITRDKMAESDGKGKLLQELRVIDLKQELENRGIDKTGIKAALFDRLKKVSAKITDLLG